MISLLVILQVQNFVGKSDEKQEALETKTEIIKEDLNETRDISDASLVLEPDEREKKPVENDDCEKKSTKSSKASTRDGGRKEDSDNEEEYDFNNLPLGGLVGANNEHWSATGDENNESIAVVNELEDEEDTESILEEERNSNSMKSGQEVIEEIENNSKTAEIRIDNFNSETKEDSEINFENNQIQSAEFKDESLENSNVLEIEVNEERIDITDKASYIIITNEFEAKEMRVDNLNSETKIDSEIDVENNLMQSTESEDKLLKESDKEVGINDGFDNHLEELTITSTTTVCNYAVDTVDQKSTETETGENLGHYLKDESLKMDDNLPYKKPDQEELVDKETLSYIMELIRDNKKDLLDEYYSEHFEDESSEMDDNSPYNKLNITLKDFVNKYKGIYKGIYKYFSAIESGRVTIKRDKEELVGEKAALYIMTLIMDDKKDLLDEHYSEYFEGELSKMYDNSLRNKLNTTLKDTLKDFVNKYKGIHKGIDKYFSAIKSGDVTIKRDKEELVGKKEELVGEKQKLVAEKEELVGEKAALYIIKLLINNKKDLFDEYYSEYFEGELSKMYDNSLYKELDNAVKNKYQHNKYKGIYKNIYKYFSAIKSGRVKIKTDQGKLVGEKAVLHIMTLMINNKKEFDEHYIEYNSKSTQEILYIAQNVFDITPIMNTTSVDNDHPDDLSKNSKSTETETGENLGHSLKDELLEMDDKLLYTKFDTAVKDFANKYKGIDKGIDKYFSAIESGEVKIKIDKEELVGEKEELVGKKAASYIMKLIMDNKKDLFDEYYSEYFEGELSKMYDNSLYKTLDTTLKDFSNKYKGIDKYFSAIKSGSVKIKTDEGELVGKKAVLHIMKLIMNNKKKFNEHYIEYNSKSTQEIVYIAQNVFDITPIMNTTPVDDI